VEHLGEGVDVALGGRGRGLEQAADHRQGKVLLLPEPANDPEPLEVLLAVEGHGAPGLAGPGQEASRR